MDVSELDDGYRIAWGYGGPSGEIRDKPVQVDHLRHSLQLYHAGYHQFSSHVPEGLASCLKVLIGTLIVILADMSHLFKDFKGRTALYEGWRKANATFSPGSQEYAQYMKQVSLHAVVLQAGGSM